MTKRVARYGRLGPAYELIPRPVYLFARNLWLDIKSLPRRLSGKNPGPEPWMVLHNFGGSDFYSSGARSCRMVQKRLGFGPDAKLLDIGCGTGRLAWPLHEVLNEEGGYIGFDVSARAIAFASRLLKPHRPDFEFHHADLYSGEYNPHATLQARDYRFPCEDKWADAAVANSLFTHLLEDDAQNFLNELARALKPTGKAYVTAYLINEVVRSRMEEKSAAMPMLPYKGPIWVGDMETPEAATGYDEDYFLAMLERAGLEIEGEILRGDWSMPPKGAYKQDAIILKRK